MRDPLFTAAALGTGALIMAALSFRVQRTWLRLALRVVAAWLMAIAMLSAIIPLVVTTPGYAEDHKQ